MTDDTNLAAILQCERELLDQIFRNEPYEIEGDGPHHAAVRSGRLRLEFGYDAWRDRSVANTLVVTEPWGEELDGLHGWVRFLGEEMPADPQDTSDHVLLGPREQVRAQLTLAARLVEEIFSDPHKTRDAIHFVRGYREAYNDHASGAWDSGG